MLLPLPFLPCRPESGTAHDPSLTMINDSGEKAEGGLRRAVKDLPFHIVAQMHLDDLLPTVVHPLADDGIRIPPLRDDLLRGSPAVMDQGELRLIPPFFQFKSDAPPGRILA